MEWAHVNHSRRTTTFPAVFPAVFPAGHDLRMLRFVPECPAWCAEQGEHELHLSEAFTVQVTSPDWLRGSSVEVFVQRYDYSERELGRIEITALEDNCPLFKAVNIHPDSARRLAAALMAAADLADGDQ